MRSLTQTRLSIIPAQLWIGLLLIAITWPLNWLLSGLRTHLLFFPLWLGYCLMVDGLVFIRKGSSMLTRNWRAYVGLYLVSAPAWWLFEALNLRTHNWVYDGREFFLFGVYFLLASLSFSTVMPAVFGTAELFSTFDWLKKLRSGPVVKPTRRTLITFFVAGWVMLALLMIGPRYFFPFLWLSMYFIFAPINAWLGNRSLLTSTQKRNWRPVLALWFGVITCAFFWEMWNFYAYPKWIYFVPFVDFLHVFEMPILGYGGYLPFSLELFALYHLVIGMLPMSLNDFIQIGRD